MINVPNPLEQFEIKFYSFVPGSGFLTFCWQLIQNNLFMFLVFSAFCLILAASFILYNTIFFEMPAYLYFIQKYLQIFFFILQSSLEHLFHYFYYTFFLVGTFLFYYNLNGEIPYTFPVTSHFGVALTISLLLFLTFNIISFSLHGKKMLTLFHPAGCPIMLLPFLALIELISYLARALSLPIRLFANITAGHCLLVIFSVFLYYFLVLLINVFPFGLVIPNSIIMVIYFLEISIASLQAYVFLNLATLYLRDAIYLH